MERLFLFIVMLMTTLIIIKILIFYLMARFNKYVYKNKSRRTAESIIIDTNLLSSTTIEEKSKYLREKISFMLKSKRLNRKTVLNIKSFIKQNLKYKDEGFNNDAHYIYSALKHSPKLSPSHINAIYNILKKSE